MCFSAEASFGASVIITTIGVVAYKKANKTPFRLLAVIPLFFGVRQFLEGIVWLGLSHESFEPFLPMSTYGFIIFAWVIWPIYIPFSLWKLEKHSWRKKILLALTLVGLLTSLALIYVMISRPIQPKIVDCGIFYNFNGTHSLTKLISVFYLSSSVLSTLVSSVRKMWIFGILNLITYSVSKIYYHDQIISVWCFFAAITSILMLWIIKHQYEVKKSTKIPGAS